MENETTLESPSLRDQLESAIETVTETPEVIETKTERARDESGKFTKAETLSMDDAHIKEHS